MQFKVNGTNPCRSLAINILSTNILAKAKQESNTIETAIIKMIKEDDNKVDQVYYASKSHRGQFVYRPTTTTSLDQLCLEINLLSAQLTDSVRIVLDVSYRLGNEAFEQSIGQFRMDTEVLHLCFGDHLLIKASNYLIIVRHYVYDLDGRQVNPTIIFTADQSKHLKKTVDEHKSKQIAKFQNEEQKQTKLKISWNEENLDFENYFQIQDELIKFTTGNLKT